MKKNVIKGLITLLGGALLLTLSTVSCKNWMTSDDFLTSIEEEVRVANAKQIPVYIRFANQKMGSTEPNGSTTKKVEVAFKVSAVTADDYAFVKWAAFSTKDFPTGSQHNNLYYATPEDYKANFASKELPDSVVSFSYTDKESGQSFSAYDTDTWVTIKKDRSDVFLIPIVAKRPSVTSSQPASGASGVVKNMAIRIVFSKPVSKSTLEDNIEVTSGTAVFTDETDEAEIKTITDLFDISLSSTGKMLTLKLKENCIMESNSQIIVHLYDDITDIYGYKMAEAQKISFTTGTATDILAPAIEVLKGGVKTDFQTFASENATVSYDPSITDVNNIFFSELRSSKTDAKGEPIYNLEPRITQRTKDNFNIYVMAEDLVGNNNNNSNLTGESDVATISVRAFLVADKDGNPLKSTFAASDSINRQEAASIGYATGTIAKGDSEKNPLLSKGTLTGYVSEHCDYNDGMIFNYDVSGMPDGLIKVDVWATDMTGNQGVNETKYIKEDECNNGVKSFYIIKDTTPPNIEVEKEKLVSNSDDAPYFWYNKSTLSSMNIYDLAENLINDDSHAKLRSLDKNLKWIFKVGGDGNWKPTATDANWVKIHDDSGLPVKFPFNKAVAEKDGAVSITMCLMDDLENISDPVILDSIMYDNTKPVVNFNLNADGSGAWVDSSDAISLNSSKTELVNQILKVPFVEELSGVRKIGIKVNKDDDAKTSVAQDLENLSVKYKDSTTSKDVALVSKASDSHFTDDVAVLDVNDNSKVTTGTLYLSGLYIGNTDGMYNVQLDLYDSALNQLAEPVVIKISKDTVAPVVKSVKVLDVQKRINFTDNSVTYWLKKTLFNLSKKPDQAKLEIKVTENGSGVKVIKLGGNVVLSNSLDLYNGNTKIAASEYVIDTEANTITLLDSYNPKLQSKSGDFTIKITNVEFKKINEASGNQVEVYLTDFVENTGNNQDENGFKIAIDDTTTVYKIYADNKNPKVKENTVILSDRKQRNQEFVNSYWSTTNQKYTDEKTVNLKLTLSSETLTSGSGITKLELTNGTFTTSGADKTEIKVNGTKLTSGYTLSEKSVTFTKAFTVADELEFTNVNITDLTNGVQRIGLIPTNFTGWTAESDEKSQATFYLDTVAPELTALAETSTWKGNNEPNGYARDNILSKQTMSLPFVEETTGVKKIKLEVTKDGVSTTSTSVEAAQFNVILGATTLQKTTDYTVEGNVITFASPIKTDTLKFTGIKINDVNVDTDGDYKIAITAMDIAENTDATSKIQHSIKIDNTAPVINSVKVTGIIPKEIYNDATVTYWLPQSVFDDSRVPNKNELVVEITEKGSGIKTITLGKNVKLTANSVLYVIKNGVKTALTSSDYAMSVSDNKLTLKDAYNPVIYSGNIASGRISIAISNIEFTNINSTDGNEVLVTVEDFVNSTGSNKVSDNYNIYLDSGSIITKIYADNTNPAVATISVNDRELKYTEDNTLNIYKPSNYTNDKVIDFTTKIGTPETTTGSGVKKLTLVNAILTTNSVVKVDGVALTKTTDYTISADNKCVTFKKVFVAQNEISISNIELTSTTNGTKTVDVIYTDLIGWNSAAKTSNNIYYDTVSPKITDINWEPTSTNPKGITQSTVLRNQKLNVTFTEAGTGVAKVTLNIKHNDTEVTSKAFESATDISVSYKASGAASATTLTKNTDYTLNDNILVFKEPKFSGTLTITGLTINDSSSTAEGIHKVNVTLMDIAENTDTSSSKTNNITRDITAPVVNKVFVEDILQRQAYEAAGNTYWLPAASYNPSRENSITLKVVMTEKGSGVNVVTLGQNAKLTSDSTVVISGLTTQPVKGTDYVVNTTNNTITFPNYDSNNTVFLQKSTGSLTFEVTNVTLTEENKSTGNAIEVKLTDFVENNGNNKSGTDYVLNYSDTETYTKAYIDTQNPEISGVIVKDISSGDTAYTNDLKVNLTVTMKDNAAVSPSGIKTLTLTNAKFIDSSVVILSGSPDVTLVKGTDYTVSGSTLTFAKPFTQTVTLKLENVEITQTTTTLGNKAISAKITDLTQWNSDVKSGNTICYDNKAPALSNLSWTASIGDSGYTNENILTTQTLNIPFAETPAGIKTLLLEVTQPGDTVYGTPFADAGLELVYTKSGEAAATLTKDTDFTISGKTITFKAPKLSGTLTIKNIKLAATNAEGTYTVKATLTDMAENSNASSVKQITILNDNTKPVVEKIEIPGLKKAVELAKGVSAKGTNDGTSGEYWLSSEYIGGSHGDNYSATLGKAYITINEQSSGVSLITIGGTTQLQSSSQLYMVAADGTETPVDSTKYTVDTSANTIKIINSSDSLKNGSGKSNFIILIDNLKFTKIGGADSSAAHNTISVAVRDVSLNDSATISKITLKGKTTEIDNFWTDSWHCGANTLYLDDSNTYTNQAGKTASTPGYTNDEYITLTLSMGAEGKGTSGHNKFVLTGAQFTNTTTIRFAQSGSVSNVYNYIKNKSTTYSDTIPSDKFVISADANGKNTILELKDSADNYYVFRNDSGICFTNVLLDDATTDGVKSVSIQVYDLAGWDNAADGALKSNTITLDKTKPEWRYDIFSSNYSGYATGTPEVNIYPHPDVESAKGINITGKTNGDGNAVSYFYTSATKGSEYGAVLGIPCKDSIGLHGYKKNDSVSYIVYEHLDSDTSTMTAATVVANGTIPTSDVNSNKTGSKSGWKTEFNGWTFFKAGKTYSIVVLDEAGNYSEKAQTVTIVQDTTRPSLTYDNSVYEAGGNKSLGNLISIEASDNGNVFRNTVRASHAVKTSTKNTSSTFELNCNGFNYSNAHTIDYVIKKSTYKIKIHLGTAISGKTQLNGISTTPNSNYLDAKASISSAPLDMYAITHRYRQWTDSTSGNDYPYIPAFPEGTVSPDGKDLIDLFGYAGDEKSPLTYQFTDKVLWREYKANSSSYLDDGITHEVDSDGNIVITIPTSTLEVCPPLTLLLKDGTGNLNYLLIKPVSMESNTGDAVAWVVDNKLGAGNTKNGINNTNRNVGMNVYMGLSATDENVKHEVTGPAAYKLNGNTDAARKAPRYYYGAQTSKWRNAPTAGMDGQSVLYTLMRDTVGKVTYYNDNAYIGLFNSPESCLFSTAEVSFKDFSDGKGYTVRARIRAWPNDGTKPGISDFVCVKDSDNFPNYEGTDFSSWYYVRSNDSGHNNEYTFQYPHPTSRTEPYKLYYYVEDAAGNYEINTIVNDNADIMDLWMYDNAGPSVKTRSGNKDPSTITGTDIDKLVATNNGFNPYYKATDASSGVGYVVRTDTLRSGLSLPNKEDIGNGIVLGCVGGGENRKYGNYFDLNITETSGIRAFIYTTSAAVPDYKTGKQTMGDDKGDAEGKNKTWYAGVTTCDGTTAMIKDREIGSDMPYPYKASNSGTKLYSNEGNVNYDYYDSSYGTDKYSGVKVVATIPNDLVVTNATIPLYLHVMDWVGNITTVQLGKGINWKADLVEPEHQSFTTTYNDDNFIEASTYGSSWTRYTFAATKSSISGDDVTADSFKIYLPNNRAGDNGSGLYGWSRTNYDKSSVLRDTDKNNQSYILLTDAELQQIKDGGAEKTITLYLYDNVGWTSSTALKVVGDKKEITPTLFVRAETTDPETTHGPSYYYNSDTKATDYRASANLKADVAVLDNITDMSDIKTTVYIKNNYLAFLPNFGQTPTDGTALPTDFYDAAVQKWDSSTSKWVVDENDTYLVKNWQKSDNHKDATYYEATVGYTYFTTKFHSIPTDGGYYRFMTRDKAGNESYSYIKVVKDTTAPEIQLTDSDVSFVNNVSGVNYYNPNSKVSFTVTDSDSGVKQYGSTETSGYKPTVSVTDYSLKAISTATSSHTMKITVKDNLETSADRSLSYNSSTSWIYDATAPSVKTINKQSAEYNIWWRDINNVNNNPSIADYPSGNFAITETTIASDESRISSKISMNPKTVGTNTVYNITTSNVKSFKFKPETTSSDLLGWYVSNSSTKPDFVAKADLATLDNGWYLYETVPETVSYVYPVDKAGNVGASYTLNFAKAITPNLEKINVKNEVEDASGNTIDNHVVYQDTKYYFNADSVISVEVTNPSTTDPIEITGFTLDYKQSNSKSGRQAVTLASPVTIAAGAKLAFTLPMTAVTGTLADISSEINNYKITVTVNTEYATSNSKAFSSTPFYYDGTGPVLSSIATIGKNASDASGYGFSSGYTITFGGNTSKLIITPTAADSAGTSKVGLHATPYSLNGTDWSASTVEITSPVAGTKTLYVRDKLGNQTTQSLTLSKDTTSPVISSISDSTGSNDKATCDSSNNKVYFANGCGDITFEITASDANGIAGYKLDNATQLSNQFTVTPVDGKTIKFYAIDKVGNVSAATTYSFVKDTSVVAPTITNIKFFNSSLSEVTSSNASGSGTSYYYHSGIVTNAWIYNSEITEAYGTVQVGYSSDINTQPENWNASGNACVIMVDTSKTTYYIWSKDAVGNTNTTPVTLKADSDNPTITIKTSDAFDYVSSTDAATLSSKAADDALTNGDVFYSTKDTIGLSISVADGKSGVKGLSDGSDITVTAGAATATLSAGSATTYTVTDKVGHTATFTLTLNQHTTAPSITGVTVSTTGGIETISNVNFYKDASATVTATDDLNISYGLSTSSTTEPSSWAASNSIALPNTATNTTYYVWAKDILGNTSKEELKNSTYTDNAWCYDGTAPTGTASVESYTNEGDGYYFDSTSNKLYYNTALQSSTDLTLTGYDDETGGSGFAGYTIGTTGTPSSKVTINDFSSSEVKIYAWDKVGNRTADEVLSITLVQANAAPTPTGGIDEGIGFTGNGDIPSTLKKGFKGHSFVDASGNAVTLLTGNDNELGDGYITKLYPSGTKVVLPITTSFAGSQVAYVIKGGNTSTAYSTPEASDYSAMTSLTGGNLTIELPEIADYHGFLFVFLKDQVGNTAVYNIGNSSNPGQNWMAQYKPISDTSPEVAFVEAGTAGNEKEKYVLYLTGLSVQSPIKSIKLNGNYIAYQTFTVNAYYESKQGSSKKVTSSVTYGTEESGDQYNPTFTFTGDYNYIAGGQRIEIEIAKSDTSNDSTISKVILTDCKGVTKEITTVSTTAPAALDASRIGFLPGLTQTGKKAVKKIQTTVKNLVTPSFDSTVAKSVKSDKKVEKKQVSTIIEVPVEEIPVMKEFESIDVEKALANSFNAGTISEKTMVNEKNNQGLLESVETVAPLFDTQVYNDSTIDNGIGVDTVQMENNVNPLVIAILISLVCVAIIVISFIILKKIVRKNDN